jgi:hypothetical protein
VATSMVELLGVELVAVVAGVVRPSVPVAVVTALRVREWCGDWIAGGAKFGTCTFNILITGEGWLMSGRMIGGSWSVTSCFLAGALPGGLTACLSFCLVPVSFLALGAGVEPTATFLAEALPTGDEAKGLAIMAVFQLLGGSFVEAGLSLVAMAVLLPALLAVAMSLEDVASPSAGFSGAGVGRRAGVGVKPTLRPADVMPVFFFLGIT